MRELSPMRLWDIAAEEHPDDADARKRRYHDLMVEHGHIVCKTCGKTKDDPEATYCSSSFHL